MSTFTFKTARPNNVYTRAEAETLLKEIREQLTFIDVGGAAIKPPMLDQEGRFSYESFRLFLAQRHHEQRKIDRRVVIFRKIACHGPKFGIIVACTACGKQVGHKPRDELCIGQANHFSNYRSLRVDARSFVRNATRFESSRPRGIAGETKRDYLLFVEKLREGISEDA